MHSTRPKIAALKSARSIPKVILTKHFPIQRSYQYEWDEDCWVTPDGKIYVPADERVRAFLNSFAFNLETLPPKPKGTKEQKHWKPRYARFLQYSYLPEATTTRLIIEVPGLGKGLAGEDFG